MRTTLTILSLLILISSAWGQSKHPRVAELEDLYKKQSIDYLESRFPGLPFSVIISVDPLRRLTSYDQSGEELPFYAVEEEEIRDEWDDPKATLYALSVRVKKVKVTLHVPESIVEDELAEIQTTLTEVLRLVPARDEIKILKRNWNMFPKLKDYALFGAVAMVVFLLGLLIILRSSVGKMTKSMSNMQNSIAQASSNGGSAAPPRSSANVSKSSSGNSGDIQFTDPIKTREVIGKRIEDLLDKDDFLRLDNIIKMNELAEEDPNALGALLVNFPVEMQKKIFSMTMGTNWMEAFVYPGNLDNRCLYLVEELCRVKPDEYNKNWQHLLIQIWRLGSKSSHFLKNLDKEEAFSILNSMPKFIAVPTARTAYPGNWATIIDPGFKTEPIDNKRCIEIYNEALKLTPPNDFDQLKSYKHSKELLQYLKETSINEEREVYEALPDKTALSILRPPFYILFDQKEEVIQSVVEDVSIDDWALALFNVQRDERRKVEQFFSEKEKFLFLEKLRYLDNDKPSAEEVGGVRESIALTVDVYALRDFIDQPSEEEQSEDKDDVDDQQVA